MAEKMKDKAQQANQALYNKMRAAQGAYRDWLLNHAYEYVVREDILLSMEYRDIGYPQAKALLKLADPVSDIFKDFEKLET